MHKLDEFDPEHETMAYYHALLDQVLCVLLQGDPEAGDPALQVFDTSQGQFSVAFDSELRLAEFAGDSAFFVEMSGRALVQSLRDMGLGLGVNLDVAPSSALLPADVIAWLADQADAAPDESHARPVDFAALPTPRWCDALIARLQPLDVTKALWIATGLYEDGAARSCLIYPALPSQITPSVAKLSYDVARFAAQEGDADDLEVIFLPHGDPLWLRLVQVGLKIDVPKPTPQEIVQPLGPGLDPTKPPILR